MHIVRLLGYMLPRALPISALMGRLSTEPGCRDLISSRNLKLGKCGGEPYPSPLPVMLLRVMILFDLPFLPIFDYFWMWLREWLSYKWQCVVIKRCNVENIVIPHCFW